MTRLCLPILLLAGTIWSQEVKHAPTADQCRADQALWLSKLEGATPMSETYVELGGWEDEMAACEKVDPPFQLRYYNTGSEASVAQKLRLKSFLSRHNLAKQFLEEDAAGTR